MSRRPFAPPLVVAVLVLAAGCIAGVPGGIDGTDTPTPTPATTTDGVATPTPTPTPEPTRQALDRQSYPWKPEPLRASNVEVYVREYERTVQYNELVGKSVVAVEQTCQAALVAQVDAGYLVRAECGGSVRERTDGSVSVGAVAPERVTYYVDDSTVERIAGEDRQLEPYRADDGGLNVATPEGLAVVNADDRSHDLEVAVHYDGATDEAVLDEEVAVAPGEGLDLNEVAAREGTYNLSVELENETTAYRWQVDGGEATHPDGVGVIVAPGGEVVVIRLPRMQ